MTTPDLVGLRRLAEQLAAGTAELAATGRRRFDLETQTKSSPTDLVTRWDRACEEHLAHELARLRPEDGLIGEEGAARPSSTGLEWIVDPIDGTTNFVYDLSTWSVSVAVRDSSGVLAGAVAVPGWNEVFSAHRGGGATCNGETIQPTSTTDLARALVATGFSYAAETRRGQAARMALLLPQVRDMRRLGSAALDLCLVASGRVDLYFEEHLNTWDVAAGELIATEAGCRSGDFRGGPARPEQILVCTPALFDPMAAMLDGVAGSSL